MVVENLKNKMHKKDIQYIVFFSFLLLVGILVRTLYLSKFPSALNCDEASSGYEAFSILNYGIDRNGNHNPVFLVAWGGGQNALLSYLIVPFIKIFGLNFFSIRIPMALLGSISLVIFYFLLKKISNKKMAIIGFAFFVICPWHILKSRWGLESNLFPDLILLFSFLFIKGILDNKKWLYYLSFVVAGLSSYSYGTSYYFLPVFLIPLLGYSIYKNKINLKEAILGIGIVFAVSLPVILYVVINTLGLDQINLPFLTIPKLEVNRYQEITSIFSSGFITNSFSNFFNSVKILVTQNDGLPWNSIFPYGTIYLFSSLFTLIGIVFSFKKKKEFEIKYDYLFKIWLIVGFILTFICEPNINRLNILMIPILYYTIVGLYLCVLKLKKFSYLLFVLYIVSFACFLNTYIHQDFNSYGTFEGDLGEVISYIEQYPDKEIHITNKIQSSYMHVLFYTKYDTREFVKTVDYEDPKAPFKNVLSFGNYSFDSIENLMIEENQIYVLKKEEEESFNTILPYSYKEFKRYFVIET